jgi:hypothetical protein
MQEADHSVLKEEAAAMSISGNTYRLSVSDRVLGRVGLVLICVIGVLAGRGDTGAQSDLRRATATVVIAGITWIGRFCDWWRTPFPPSGESAGTTRRPGAPTPAASGRA